MAELPEAEVGADAPPVAPAASPSPPAASTTPSVQVQEVVVAGVEERKLSRWLGLSVANMKEPIPGAPEDRRGVVTRAFRGGPGHKAGLRRGDVLLRARDREVLRYQDYLGEARNVEIGEALPVVVLRDGKEISTRLVMIEKPKDLRAWKLAHWPGTEAPGYSRELLRGGAGRVTEARAKGRPTILYFWATWCGPCRQTSPMLDDLLAEVGPEKLELLAVSSEERQVLDGYLAKSETSYPIVRDDKAEMKLDYEVKKLPTVVLIDGQGKVVAWDTSVGGVRRIVQEARKLIRGG